MVLDYALLADGVTQRQDGKLDIYGAGYDTVYAATVAVRHDRLTMVLRVLLTRHETEAGHRLEVVIQSADGPKVARASTQMEPLDAASRAAIPAGRPRADHGASCALHNPASGLSDRLTRRVPNALTTQDYRPPSREEWGNLQRGKRNWAATGGHPLLLRGLSLLHAGPLCGRGAAQGERDRAAGVPAGQARAD